MMKTKYKFDNIEEQDEFIQSLPLKELKKLNEGNQFLFINKGEIEANNDDDIQYLNSMDETIQNMQLNELKEIYYKKQLTSLADEELITEKAKLTGLDKKIILLIETKKEKATLEQIIIYCKKLNIPFQKFVPEFFKVL
jgi:hypothetical protein